MRILLLLFLGAVVVVGAKPILRAATDVPAAVSLGSAIVGVHTDADALFCDSWRLSVETANAGPVSAHCGAFVREYMKGEHYAFDSPITVAESLAFAVQAFASGEEDTRPAWVFDVDEILLSNTPYYAVSGWG